MNNPIKITDLKTVTAIHRSFEREDGLYVLTAIENMKGSKFSYWLTKENYVKCIYCFSAFGWDIAGIDYQIQNIDSYIRMFKEVK